MWRNKGEGITIIDIANDFSNEREFRLSEIAYDIEYIKLEATPDSYVGGGLSTWLTNDEYVFVYNRNRLLQFSRSGRFIREIGKYGRGPGELTGINGMTLDEKNNKIYIIVRGKKEIVKYDVASGEYLGNFPIKDYSGSPLLQNSFQILENNTFAILSPPFSQYQPDYKLLEIIDDKGNELATKTSFIFSYEDNEKREKGQYSFDNHIWVFNNQPRLFEGLNDTIYNIFENQLVPAYILNLGKLKGPFDVMTNLRPDNIRHTNYFHIGSVWESQSDLYFLCMYDSKTFVARYSKDQGEFFRLINPYEETNRLLNDLDGGLSLWPIPAFNRTFRENEWIFYIDAFRMKQELTTDFLESSEAIYPEKKEKLINFVDELLIDDNPVLMIIKLKE